ncbi:hypothetical protein [Vulcanisaeta souniana]|uniref:Uncharacterized protein n=1 Tax=Vulcanisaeta souniana JCM 11219 TaxID=1293586 RepID=A0A830EGH0_9CREN|nr:hypothetical protein [Vulcanisaeta souniana]BDR92289.1 hypothetical protein Vsou_13820 [Vulcanisaeta souniana JCM 11219]GGI74444.1 hypothetical protein GCM10007112_08990 [Vulcanisaeta souniana JCM 11219]
MSALRIFFEVLLIIVALALIYTIVEPFKAELKTYIFSIGNEQASELLYMVGYIIYKLGYLSYMLLKTIALYSYQAIQYLLSNPGFK